MTLEVDHEKPMLSPLHGPVGAPPPPLSCYWYSSWDFSSTVKSLPYHGKATFNVSKVWQHNEEDIWDSFLSGFSHHLNRKAMLWQPRNPWGTGILHQAVCLDDDEQRAHLYKSECSSVQECRIELGVQLLSLSLLCTKWCGDGSWTRD